MEYRILGRTGLKASVFGIGSWQLSGSMTIDGRPDGFPDLGSDRVISLIQSCGDLGINLIDTAEIYGNGEGERRIGMAIDGQRDRWILSSKFGMRCNNGGQRIVDSHPDTIRQSLESSLRRLKTDYIDIYLYHAPPQPEWIETGKTVLETLKQEGKIRFYGISTDNYRDLQSLVDFDAVDVVCCSQSLINYPAKTLDLVKNNNLGLITRGALAAGQLSGKYFRHSPQISAHDFRYQLKFSWDKYKYYENFLPEGASMVSFALRYLLDSPTTQTIILGGKSIANYQEALTALDLDPLCSKTHLQLYRIRQRQNLLRRAKNAVKKMGKKLVIKQ